MKFRLALPHVAFNRRIGEFRAVDATPEGRHCQRRCMGGGEGDCCLRQRQRLHLLADAAGARAGEFAGWIAPPKLGIDNKPGDFEYVKIEAA